MGTYTPKHSDDGSFASLEPQLYDDDASHYLTRNATEIDRTALILGVSSNAIAGSMAREITRADTEALVMRLAHGALLVRDNIELESGYEREIKTDFHKLSKNPGVFDGSYSILHELANPTLSDIGPSAIRILAAVQIISQFKDTPQGIALGLNKYSEHDIKTIVAALQDRDNPLSVHLAGLAVLDGQRFFVDKSIAGIPWNRRTEEEQDAALIAYYSAGEHAVSADMAAGDFRPFTRGPTGGQVGQWILYGDNFNKLKAITNSAQFRLNAIAPISGKHSKQPSTKQRQGAQNHAALEIGRWLRASEMPAVVRARQALLAVGKGLPKSLSKMNGADLSIISKFIKSSANETFRRILAWRSDMQTHIALGASRPSGIAPSGDLARSISAAMRYTSAPYSAKTMLPSVAPIKENRAVIGDTISKSLLPKLNDRRTAPDDGAVEPSDTSSTREPFKFGEALNEYFMRQARLPPAGGTAFDPRLTPAWAGVKLPV